MLAQNGPATDSTALCDACRYAPMTVGPSTILNFRWTEQNGVDEIPSGDCPASFIPGNGITVLAPVKTRGNFFTSRLSPGIHYFASPVRSLQQKLRV